MKLYQRSISFGISIFDAAPCRLSLVPNWVIEMKRKEVEEEAKKRKEKGRDKNKKDNSLNL